MTKVRKIFPIIFLVLVSIVFFYKFFFSGLIPIPADITVGMYYPWLNQKWGNIVGVSVKNPLMSDIVSIIYEWRILAIDSIKNGQFPLWNPSYFMGMPLFANFQTSLINLTNIAFLLPLKNGFSWGLMIYLQLPLSLLSSYLFLKSYKFSFLACVCGAVTYALSLFSLTWLEYGVHVYTAIFLPLMLWSIKKYTENNHQKYLIFFSLFTALQIYGGYPQYAIYSLGFSLVYFLLSLTKFNLKTVINFSVFVLLGLGLAAPLLLPGYELIKRSINKIDLTSVGSNSGFLPTENLLTAVSPNYFGNPATYDYYGKGFYDNNAFYPGIIAIIAFLSAFLLLFNKKDRPNKDHFLFTFTIIIVFVLVTANPISVFLKNNLGLVMAKNGLATRFFLLSNLSFCFLVGWFINTVFSKKNLSKTILTASLILFFWQIILIAKNILPGNPSSVSLKNTAYTLVFSLPITALLIFNKRLSFFKPLIFMVLFSELFYYGQKYLPFSPPKYLFPETPVLAFLKQNSKNYRIATNDTIPENMWVPYGLKTPDGYDTLVPLQNYQFLSFVNYGNFPTSAYRAAKLTNFQGSLVNQLSVKYVLKQSNNPASFPTEFNPKNYQTVFAEGRVIALENKNVLPRARLISNFVISTSSEDTQKFLANNLPNDTLIINDPISFDPLTITNCVSKNSNVSFTKDTDNQISLSVSSDCPRLLFLADSWYPGWLALIDNKSTKIYRVNHNFRAIYIPIGNHQITFTYFPNNFKCGLWLMSLASISLIFLSMKLRHA